MAKKVVQLRVDVSVKTEKREGYFASTTEPFAVTAYGKTANEAEKRAWEGLNLLMEKHSETPDKAAAYLNKLHVKHSFITKELTDNVQVQPQVIRECRQELNLEMILVPA